MTVDYQAVVQGQALHPGVPRSTSLIMQQWDSGYNEDHHGGSCAIGTGTFTTYYSLAAALTHSSSVQAPVVTPPLPLQYPVIELLVNPPTDLTPSMSLQLAM